MATTVPTKSTLKQRTPQQKNAPSAEQNAQAEKDRRNLTIALSHANKLELQKKIQLQIVKNIESLLDLPPSPTPSATDARTFTTLIHLFQPSDFASLVEERRINGSCGYALCPNPPRSETLGPSASWKLKGKGAGDFCSTECVRKALYVKAQLSEVPAWERVGGEQARVVLPEGDRVNDGGEAMGGSGGGERVANEKDLAGERGEEVTSFKPRQVMMDSVVEKQRSSTTSAPAFPRPVASGSRGGAIEGYKSTFSNRRSNDDGIDEDEDEDAADGAQAVDFTSEIRPEDDDNHFDEEEEAAWRELQAGLRHLNTAHDR